MKALVTTLLAVLMALVLPGCGGNANAQAQGSFSGNVPGGYNNVISRDASQASGGVPGFVNTAATTRSIVGADVTAFEWVNLSILDNYAAAGENVALYAQSNKRGPGGTWGAVSQVVDFTTNSGATVVHEFDLAVRGPDNGNRIGLDVVLGRTKEFPGDPKGVGSVGVRVGTSDQTKWTRGVQFLGEFDSTIDTSRATTSTALRMAEGQSIELDATGAIKMNYRDGRIRFMNADLVLFEIDANKGRAQ